MPRDPAASAPGALARAAARLLDPAVPVSAARRRQARLLATFLCLLVAVFGVVDAHGLYAIPGYRPPWYGYLCLLTAWLLNRSGRYNAAAALTLAMFPAVILAMIASGTGGSPAMNLAYLALGAQLAGILLPARGTAAFAALLALCLLAAPRISAEPIPAARLATPLALVAIAAGLAVVSIHHRDRLERDRQSERETLIRELEGKNTELERFSYTVSHDLRSPLITIRGFIGMLARDLAQGRHDRLAADLDRIGAAAGSMERLLNELLRLSRVGRVVNTAEHVPFALIVGEAAQLVRARLDARGIRLQVDEPLPEVYGDRTRLVEVLQNLLENAAKFRGGEADPWVHVGAREPVDGAGPVYFVADNGIGIDPRHHERVFGLFHKLDGKAEGTGVGLALVRRVIEVHGGRVWIESEGPERGTAVCFTLPAGPSKGAASPRAN